MAIGADQQFAGQRLAIVEHHGHRIWAHFKRQRCCRAEQLEIALPLDAFPQFASHQRGFKNPTKFGDAAVVSREIELCAGVAMNLHGVDRRQAARVEMLPGADPLEKFSVSRADGIDARVYAISGARWLILNKGNFQVAVAQGAGQRKSGQTTANDYNIKRH